MNEDWYAEMKAGLSANATEHASFKRRLDACEDKLGEQTKMLVIMERQSNAIENMNAGIGRVEKKVDSIDGRVAVLEKEPADKWKKLAFEIVKYVVIAALGLAVGYIIKGLGGTTP